MIDGHDLRATTRLVWGKSGDWRLGPMPLWRHLADTADVAGRLWGSWLSSAVKNRICRDIPGGETAARPLIQWLAGVHDIGKATPAFAYQVPPLADRMRIHGYTFDRQVEASRKLAPHATAGQILLTEWLMQRHGWDAAEAGPFAVVVGGHHGTPPTDLDIKNARDRRYLLGVDGLWPQAREDLLTWMTRRVGAEERLPEWREVELTQPVQVLLTAIVIVADWIASNEEFFPYGPEPPEDSQRTEEAWLSLDLPEPWHALKPASDVATLFNARFDLPAGSRPFPVQAAAVVAAGSMPTPGLMIIEAPMGEGKTEAALAAVEILAARVGAGGCYVALPTRATADAMFSRVLSWLGRLPDADVGRGAYDTVLAHGKAVLNNEFAHLYLHGLPSKVGIDDGGADIAVHRWLAGRKRKLLTNFAIGTIDQLLFAALKSRHVVLRHLGLAGKIVVIDEAHAYDVYMSSYLDRALHWLGAYGVPVVLLSATLPARRRAEMMEAYDGGRLGPAQRPHSAGQPPDPYQGVRDDHRYPLLTLSGMERQPTAVACNSAGRQVAVRIAMHVDDPLVLADTLRGLLDGGGCVLVLCNTVSRVQNVASVLREELGPDTPVSVAHSRFMGPDRAAKDRWLRDMFGPPALLAHAGRARPLRHVVVATQVAEQSLDIDFDLLVTDLAPVDLLLQRIGRLHRHDRPRPDRLSQPQCLVVGAEWDVVPPAPVRGSIQVYEKSALLRSAAVLWTRLIGNTPVVLPDDISPLVQAAYDGSPVGPSDWQAALADAATQAADRKIEKQNRAKTFRIGPVRAGRTLVGWLDGAAGDVEGSILHDAGGRAHVRDDGAENVEVLVLIRRDDRLFTPPWLASDGDIEVSRDIEPPARVAKTIMLCSLALPPVMTAKGGAGRIITELEQRNAFPAWAKNQWLSGELILDLDDSGCTELAGFAFHYDRDDGLRVTAIAAN